MVCFYFSSVIESLWELCCYVDRSPGPAVIQCGAEWLRGDMGGAPRCDPTLSSPAITRCSYFSSLTINSL